MSIFGEKCARCGDRTRNKIEDSPTCEACVAEMDLLVGAQSESDRLCPVDGAVMAKEIAHMLVIDRCPTCQGVWLDSGELDRIKHGAETGAIMAMAGGFTSPLG